MIPSLWRYEFVWSAYIWGPNPEYDRDMAAFYDNYSVPMYAFVEADPTTIDFTDASQFRTPIGGPNLAIATGVLNPGVTYAALQRRHPGMR